MSCRAGRHIAMLPEGADVPRYGGHTVFRIRVPDNYTFSIYSADLVSGVVLAIDWGDGVSELRTESWPSQNSPSPSHTYAAGTYDVSLSNVVTSLSVSPVYVSGSSTASSPVVAILAIGSRLKVLGATGFSYAVDLAEPTVLADSNISRFASPSLTSYQVGPFYAAKSITEDAAWLPRKLVGKFPAFGLAASGLTSLANFPCDELDTGTVDLSAAPSFTTTTTHPSQSAHLTYHPADMVWTLTFASGVLEDFIRRKFLSNSPDSEFTGLPDQWTYDTWDSTPVGTTARELLHMTRSCELHITDDSIPANPLDYRRQLSVSLDITVTDGVVSPSEDTYPIQMAVTISSMGLALSSTAMNPVSSWVASTGAYDRTPELTVVDIGDRAFQDCKDLESIGSSFKYIRDIGPGAFSDCTSLGPCYPEKQMLLALTLSVAGRPIGRRVGAHAFDGCTSLEYIMREPNGTVWFESYAFANCTGITTIDGLSIAGYSFHATLKNGTLTKQDKAAVSFDTTHHPPNPVTSLSGRTATLTVPDGRTLSFTWDARQQFGYNWYNNTTVSDAKAVPIFLVEDADVYVGPYCFSGCAGLTSTRGLPFSVRDYPEGLFQGCTGLTEYIDVSDPGASGEFDVDSHLEMDFVPTVATVTSGTYSNSNFTVNNGKPLLKTIGKDCFKGCTALETMTFTGVTAVGESAFSDCTSLRRIDFLPYSMPVYQAATKQTIYATSDLLTVGARFLDGCTHTGADPGESGSTSYMHELVIRFDSKVMPTFAPDALTDARRGLATTVGGFQSPWLVLQFRSLTLADGTVFSGGTASWASDEATRRLLYVQCYQKINDPLYAPLADSYPSGWPLSTGYYRRIAPYSSLQGKTVTVGFADVNSGSRIDAPIGTVFKVPLYLVAEYPSSSTRDFKMAYYGYVDAQLSGWEWFTGEDSNGFSRPKLTFVSNITPDVSGFPSGYTAVYACLSVTPVYEPAVMRGCVLMTSAAATTDGNLQNKEFVLDLEDGTDVASGVDIDGITIKLGATSYTETAEDGTTTTVQVPESTVTVVAERSGEKLVVDNNHNPGEYLPVVKIKTFVPYKAGQSVTVVGRTSSDSTSGAINIATPLNIKAEYWPMTPNTAEVLRGR